MRRWGTVSGRKVATVPNGIDLDRYGGTEYREELRRSLGILAEHFVVGAVGRLAEVKRYDLLLSGMAKTAQTFPQVRLLIVGDGAERQRLESQALELGIHSQTIFAGYQPEPERYLQAMDLFALTSRHEALPLALLEAMAAGLPVVSTAVGGIPQVIEHGRTGLLFPSGHVEALQAAIEQLICDRQYAEGLTIAAREVVRERHSLQRMADEYELQYELAMAGVGRP